MKNTLTKTIKIILSILMGDYIFILFIILVFQPLPLTTWCLIHFRVNFFLGKILKDFLGMPIGDITSGGLYLESKGVIPQIILG